LQKKSVYGKENYGKRNLGFERESVIRDIQWLRAFLHRSFRFREENLGKETCNEEKRAVPS